MIEAREKHLQEIPEDWEVRRLGDICNVVRGASPRPAGDPKYFNGDYIPWLTVASLTGISDAQTVVNETEGALTKEGAKRSRVLKAGTVIISNSGATLGVAKRLGITCCANDGIAALQDLSDGSKEFIIQFINTQTKRLRQRVATGVGQPNLNTSLISNIQIPFPPLEEQQAIAKTLSDVDALLTSIDAAIEKKRNVKTATMQRLLTGEERLQGFEGEWKKKSLRESVSFQAGTPFSSEHFNEDGQGMRLIRNRDLKSDDQKVYYEGPYGEHEVVHNGDLLIGMDGDFQPCLWGKGKALLNQRVGRVRTERDDVDEGFLFYAIREPLQQIESNTSRTTVKHLSHTDVESIEMTLPPVDEQRAIAEILSDMDAEIASWEKRRAKTEAVKMGMMQELLTGKTRLN